MVLGLVVFKNQALVDNDVGAFQLGGRCEEGELKDCCYDLQEGWSNQDQTVIRWGWFQGEGGLTSGWMLGFCRYTLFLVSCLTFFFISFYFNTTHK